MIVTTSSSSEPKGLARSTEFVPAGGAIECTIKIVAVNVMHKQCYMRRAWAHRISFLVPRARDTAHPGSGLAQAGSGSAQDSLRLCSPLLRLSVSNTTL